MSTLPNVKEPLVFRQLLLALACKQKTPGWWWHSARPACLTLSHHYAIVRCAVCQEGRVRRSVNAHDTLVASAWKNRSETSWSEELSVMYALSLGRFTLPARGFWSPSVRSHSYGGGGGHPEGVIAPFSETDLFNNHSTIAKWHFLGWWPERLLLGQKLRNNYFTTRPKLKEKMRESLKLPPHPPPPLWQVLNPPCCF